MYSSPHHTIPSLTTSDRRQIFDAIYGNLTGAVRNEDGTVSFPCDSEVNVTFTFGGQEFPVHPLDIFFADTDGKGMCEPQVRRRCSLPLVLADGPSSLRWGMAMRSRMRCSVRLSFLESSNTR
jgi:hypothetical protein